MPSRTTGYWIVTGLFCAILGSSGFGYMLGVEYFAENLARLGYPPYVLTMLGAAKVLGVVALLAPGRPLLKEWAYAGFAFDLLGAMASHAFVGDPVPEILRPATLLLLCAASYLLRPGSRRLGSSPGVASAPV